MADADRIELTTTSVGGVDVDTSRYYDPKIKTCHVSKHTPAVFIGVPRLVREFRTTFGNRYTIPVVLSRTNRTHRRKGVRIPELAPFLWESVDSTRGPNNTWSMVIAKSGGSRHMHRIQSIRYDNNPKSQPGRFWQRGNHTLIRADVGNLIGIFQCLNGTETFLVLRIDELLPWSPLCVHKPLPSHPAAAANVSVVHAQVIDKLGVERLYKHESVTNSSIGIREMYNAAKDMATKPESRTRYVRMFIPQSSVKGRSVYIPTDLGVNITERQCSPETFMREFYDHMEQYRKVLRAESNVHASDLQPTHIEYVLTGEGNIKLTAKVPSLISEFPALVLQTELTDTLPDDVVSEPTLTCGTNSRSTKGLRGQLNEAPEKVLSHLVYTRG